MCKISMQRKKTQVKDCCSVNCVSRSGVIFSCAGPVTPICIMLIIGAVNLFSFAYHDLNCVLYRGSNSG